MIGGLSPVQLFETQTFDFSGLPGSGTVNFLYGTQLSEYLNDLPLGGIIPAIQFQDNTGDLRSDSANCTLGPPGTTGPISFLYVPIVSNSDPFTGLAWETSDLLSGNRQFGPAVGGEA